MNNDRSTTVQELKDFVKKFVAEREWDQFHSLKNLSTGLSIEAAELVEPFLWSISVEEEQRILKEKNEAIADEAADVAILLYLFCNKANIDLASAIEKKMAKNAAKYPVEKARGNNKKYTDL